MSATDTTRLTLRASRDKAQPRLGTAEPDGMTLELWSAMFRGRALVSAQLLLPNLAGRHILQ